MTDNFIAVKRARHAVPLRPLTPTLFPDGGEGVSALISWFLLAPGYWQLLGAAVLRQTAFNGEPYWGEYKVRPYENADFRGGAARGENSRFAPQGEEKAHNWRISGPGEVKKIALFSYGGGRD